MVSLYLMVMEKRQDVESEKILVEDEMSGKVESHLFLV